jgi:predicted pyridoxine 5'-phosphate oxidase superfamily flavin-nucleotide-binding protein
MDGPFHAGELEAQRRGGSLDLARAVGRSIGDQLPEGADRFFARQRLVVAASLAPDGRVWASLVTGPAGFIQVVDRGLLRLAAQPFSGDPLAANLAARPELGLLVLDPATRQRFRVNGSGLQGEEGIFVAVEQAFGNCSKYIQRRDPAPDQASLASSAVSDRLDSTQQARIAAADTLFLASAHPEGGADASHRGGFPGFVRILGPRRLAFDHYPGNGMFNTMGNLIVEPRAGLLFLDFTTGDVLQLAGEARIGEDFTLTFEIEQVRDSPGQSPLRYSFRESSPANPPLSRQTVGRHLTVGRQPPRGETRRAK